jgi:hypothetical protein
VQQIGFAAENVLQFEPYGHIHVGLGAIGDLLARWAPGFSVIAIPVTCATEHRRQKVCQLGGLLVPVHFVIPVLVTGPPYLGQPHNQEGAITGGR